MVVWGGGGGGGGGGWLSPWVLSFLSFIATSYRHVFYVHNIYKCSTVGAFL